MAAIAERSVRRPLTAWHCCLEFYSVSTRLPDEVRLQPADALVLIKQEILDRFSVHQLPPKQWTSFLESAAHDGIVGGRLYDAHVAEVARLARAKVVVTDNRRHFSWLLRHGVRVLGSEEVVRELA